MTSKKIRDVTLINTRDESFFRSYKAIAKKLGHDASILLSVLMEVDSMMDYNDGWFFQTIETLENFSLLSRHKQEKALDKLTKAGIVLQENKGMPCKRYFKIDYEALNKSLFANNSQTSMRNIDKQVCENSATSKEITDKDINKDIKPMSVSKKANGISDKDLQAIIDKWNSIGLNQVTRVNSNSTLKSYINARLKENGLEEIFRIIDVVPTNKLLMGEATDWQCNFDWIMTKSNFEKVQRGNYPPNRKGGANGTNWTEPTAEELAEKQREYERKQQRLAEELNREYEKQSRLKEERERERQENQSHLWSY